MNRLSGYSRNLREVFENTITVRYIASPLVSFDAERTALKVQRLLRERDYDHVGVRRDGLVVGYAAASGLNGGQLADHCQPSLEGDVITAEMPVLESLAVLRERRTVYVSVLGEVNGILTQGDVSKPIVRLWLFGLVMIAEMQLGRLIRNRFPEGKWMHHVKPARIKQAQMLLDKKKKSQTDPDLLDCLYFSEKLEIATQDARLREIVQGNDAASGERLSRHWGAIRNSLAHGEDIAPHWPRFLDDAEALDSFISRAEDTFGRTLRT